MSESDVRMWIAFARSRIPNESKAPNSNSNTTETESISLLELLNLKIISLRLELRVVQLFTTINFGIELLLPHLIVAL